MPESLPHRRHWWRPFAIGVLVLLAGAGFFLRPVTGPARDLTLAGDAGRGAYVMRLAGCDACHTDPKRPDAAYAGGQGLATPFGTFFPPNITPDRTTGIGDWTLAQFSDAMSNGIGRGGNNLYPVFPYENFTLMSDQEIVDLYAALMALPPVSHRAPDNQVVFPFDIRPLVSAWKNLFFRPRRFQDDPAHSTAWNRGAYLVHGPAHCVACHSPLNLLGAVEQGRQLTGNPVGGTGGKAPPLTVSALLRDGYTRASLAETLRTGITPSAGKVGHEMGPVIADGTSHWTEDDRLAVASYLLNLD